jgi:hypothetical protein
MAEILEILSNAGDGTNEQAAQPARSSEHHEGIREAE